MLSSEIRGILDSGSLASLSVSDNDLKSEGLSAIAEVLTQTSLTQLNLAGNKLTHNAGSTAIDMSGIIKFAGVLADAKGALSKLTWSGERWQDRNDGCKIKDAPPVTLDTAMTEADFSNKHLGVSGVIILAAVLRCKTFRDSGSLVSLNLAGNRIGFEGAQHVAEVLPKW